MNDQIIQLKVYVDYFQYDTIIYSIIFRLYKA